MDGLNERKKQELIKKNTPKSRVLINSFRAFTVGGAICLFAEGLRHLYAFLGTDADSASMLATLSVVLIGALLTAVGVFDSIARFAGAGTLVPITGFSNSIVSSAIDAVSEGYVTGVGAKIFGVAGPVILYGTVAGVIYGVFYYLYSFL